MDVMENNNNQYDADREFVHSAKMFCGFIEDSGSVDSRVFLKTIQLYLFKIYQSARNIEKKDTGPELLSSYSVENTQFDEILELLQIKLLNYRYYWIVFDPTNDKNTDPVCGDLLDDLGDIYKEIKRALLLYDSRLDDAKTGAIWQLKFNFENHWGDHCINAIYACHYFLRK